MAVPEASLRQLSFKDFASQQFNLRLREDFPYEEIEWVVGMKTPNEKCAALVHVLYEDELRHEPANEVRGWISWHSGRTCKIALAIAERAGFSDDQKAVLGRAALLHDIGKIGIDPAIVNKNGPLADDERSVMATHNRISQAILKYAGLGTEAALAAAHHEHQKTSSGRQRNDLIESEHRDMKQHADLYPLMAVLELADMTDAMVNFDDRPYPNHMQELFAAAARDGTLGDAVFQQIAENPYLDKEILFEDLVKVGIARAVEMRKE